MIENQKTYNTFVAKSHKSHGYICELYESGLSLRKVGEKVGLDRETVRQILITNRIDRREKGFPKPTEEIKEKIKKSVRLNYLMGGSFNDYEALEIHIQSCFIKKTVLGEKKLPGKKRIRTRFCHKCGNVFKTTTQKSRAICRNCAINKALSGEINETAKKSLL